MGVVDFDGVIDMDLGMSEENGWGMEEDMANCLKLGYGKRGRLRNG